MSLCKPMSRRFLRCVVFVCNVVGDSASNLAIVLFQASEAAGQFVHAVDSTSS